MTNSTNSTNSADSPRLIRTDFSTGEVVMAHIWLGLGAIFSLLLEVVYLNTVVTLPGETKIYFPFTVVIAFLFNMVLTKTAQLWVRPDDVPPMPTMLAAIPMTVWSIGFFIFLVAGETTGHQWMPANLLPFLLLFAGLGGGMWPILRTK